MSVEVDVKAISQALYAQRKQARSRYEAECHGKPVSISARIALAWSIHSRWYLAGAIWSAIVATSDFVTDVLFILTEVSRSKDPFWFVQACPVPHCSTCCFVQVLARCRLYCCAVLCRFFVELLSGLICTTRTRKTQFVRQCCDCVAVSLLFAIAHKPRR